MLCIVCKWMHLRKYFHVDLHKYFHVHLHEYLHVHLHKYLHVHLHKYFASRWYDLARRSSCWKQVSSSPLLGLLVAAAK